MILIQFPLPLDEISLGFHNPANTKFTQTTYDEIISILIWNKSNNVIDDAQLFLDRIDALFLSVGAEIVRYNIVSEDIVLFYDDILLFIGSYAMNGEEIGTVESEAVGYEQSNYDDLSRILLARDGLGGFQDRLSAYFFSHGYNYAANNTGKSNVFLGAAIWS